MNIIIKTITFVAITAIIPRIMDAQGTTYLSSLSYASSGSYSVGNDSWLGIDFTTGDNANGYTLDSVQLALTDASGSPSGFSVMLYSAINNATTYPGVSLGTLIGSLNPVTADTYTYTAPPDLTLSPFTQYYIVVTSGTAIANGAYEWSATSTFPPSRSGGWFGDEFFEQSSDGLNWSFVNGPYYAQFAVNATPAAEPGVLTLMTVGGLFLVGYRWKSKAV